MASQVPIPKSSPPPPPAAAPAWNGGATLRDEHERLARASEIGSQPQPGYVDESGKSKLFRKLKQEPAVPIGSLLTVGALLYASHYLRTGDRVNFQKALRWRVGLQGATIVAAIAGTLYYGSGDPAAPSASAADIATAPGRPATVHQVQRAEERKESQRAVLAERMREAEEKERLREEEEARHVDSLLRPAGGKRSWPVVGQDKRTF